MPPPAVTGSRVFHNRCTSVSGNLAKTSYGPVKSSWVRLGKSRRPIENTFRLDDKRHIRGFGHLVQPRREAAFGRIVERGRTGPGGGERRLDHRDARCVEGGAGRVRHSGGNHCETLRGQDLRENRRALDRCRSDLDHRVARTKPSGRHDPFGRDPQHLSNHERLAHCTGHLSVPADEHRSHPIERVPHVREQRFRILSGRAFGQQHAREKPSWARSEHDLRREGCLDEPREEI